MCEWKMLGLKLDPAFKFPNNLLASLVARCLNTDKSKAKNEQCYPACN